MLSRWFGRRPTCADRAPDVPEHGRKKPLAPRLLREWPWTKRRLNSQLKTIRLASDQVQLRTLYLLSKGEKHAKTIVL